jgi:acetyl-CoA carboxylase biotin carboxyl carrier protein
MSFKYKEIAEILKIIDASDCEELVLDIDGVRLAVRRQGAGAARVEELSGIIETSAPSPQGGRQQPSVDSENTPAPSEHDAQIEQRADGCIEVRAPMIGTLYRSPSPAEPVFVVPGDFVKPGQPLCLIEVMKLFTTIEATVSGKIKDIVVEDGALVGYGQVLFVLEPDGQG